MYVFIMRIKWMIIDQDDYSTEKHVGYHYCCFLDNYHVWDHVVHTLVHTPNC